MKDDSVWFGFLEAGEKGSPVARDFKLDTTKADTVYLYNFRRQEFIEYKLAIVESKLRELRADEKDLGKELEAAFKKARKDFKGKNPLSLTKITPATPAKSKKEPVDTMADAVETEADEEDFEWDDDE